jgi:hypothetical protein
MEDQHLEPEDEGTTASSGEGPARTPRWVKVSLIAAAAVALLIVILLLTGGDHGPRMHT